MIVPVQRSLLGRKTLLIACLILATGCRRGTPPVPADPAAARAALSMALDAWKKGEGYEPLTQRRPPLRVLDRDWRAGHHLLDYRLTEEASVGAELRCRVLLSMQAPNSPAIEKEAVYCVGIGSEITVSREDIP